MIITLLGSPGSGKGTQGRRLAERMSMAYVSSGDLLRRAIVRKTPAGRRARPYLERGDLVPDEVLVPLVCAELRTICGESDDVEEAGISDNVGVSGVVLDGFPRTREQAIALDSVAGGSCAVDGALFLKVPDAILIARLASRLTCQECGASFSEVSKLPHQEGVCDTCGGRLQRRGDDSASMVRHRLDAYSESVAPLVAYYRELGNLLELDGRQPENLVAEALLEATRQFAKLTLPALRAYPAPSSEASSAPRRSSLARGKAS